MDKEFKLKSEEDVRAKLILPWLTKRGFNLNEISVEFSFAVKLGRAVLHARNGELSKTPSATITKETEEPKTYFPRADVLVRNSSGQNLLIIEVKAPNEILDTNARDQGISYARLLIDGNIPPYVVVTNGLDTKIYDSITKEDVTQSPVKLNRLDRERSFTAGAEGLALQAEALELLISLSATNLIEFCEAQTEFRMNLLMDHSIDSSKKYIPSLYVRRESSEEKLLDLLDNQKRRIILLVGAPQVGKTNFICHVARERLKQMKPCIFYPAIGMSRSLLEEIQDDFEWVLGEVNETHRLIHSKLRNILRRTGERLVIFIDGWNEANLALARTIDSESERLSCSEIQIVISMTHVAATRLLRREAGNPSFIAESASIPFEAAQLIELDPDASAKHASWSVVNVKPYDTRERDEAYKKYAEQFCVEVPATHNKIFEPYALGAAMRLYKNSRLPDSLDEPTLLEKIISGKQERAVGLETYDIQLCLDKLAEEMLVNGAPVSIEATSKIWSVPVAHKIPKGFFESALLAQVTNEYGKSSVDFYYGKERDYVIAYRVQNWLRKLQNGADLSSEFAAAVLTNAGFDAVRWFFSQPGHIKYIDLKEADIPSTYEDKLVRRALLSSMCTLTVNPSCISDEWLKFAISQADTGEDNLVKIEAVKLVALLANDRDDLASVLQYDRTFEDFIVAILGIGEEYPFHTDSASSQVLDAIQSLHWESCDPDSDTSGISDVLEDLLFHESAVIREGAAECFGYAAPYAFLQSVAERIENGLITAHSKEIAELKNGISLADSTLSEGYYGSMCPGGLTALTEDFDALNEEYKKMSAVLRPIISVFPMGPTIQSFIDLLEDLNPGKYNFGGKDCDRTGESPPKFKDEHTLQLPFETDEKTDAED